VISAISPDQAWWSLPFLEWAAGRFPLPRHLQADQRPSPHEGSGDVTETPAPAAGEPSANGLARLAKQLLPGPLLYHLRALRSLEAPARWTYLRRRISRRNRRPLHRSGAPAPASILFVCYGNIIRSAMAEQLLRLACDQAGSPAPEIRSAGVRARGGRAADSRAIDLAPEFGVSLLAHRATALTPEAVSDADLIVVMDFLNEAELLTRYPSVVPKLRMIGEYLGEGGAGAELELPDPYMQDAAAVRACFIRLQQGIQRLVAVHGLGLPGARRTGLHIPPPSGPA
jgi:protein-tyrosine phosphatase